MGSEVKADRRARPAGTPAALGRAAAAAAMDMVAELDRLGLVVSRDGRPTLDQRVRDLARPASTDRERSELDQGLASLEAGAFDRALVLFRSAAHAARERGDTPLLARALTEAAGALRRMGRTAAAIDSAAQVLDLIEEGASRERGRALRILGLARRDAGDIDGALDAHTKAEYVFSVVDDADARSRELCSLGRIHMEQGRLGDAQRCFVQVLEARGSAAELAPVLIAQAGLVEVRARRGDTGEAVETLQAGLASARADGHRDAEAACLSALAYVEGTFGDAGKGDEAYAGAVELLRSRGAHRATALLHSSVAEMRAVRGDVAGAQQAIRSAEAVLGARRDPATLAAVALARGAVVEATGDLTAALASYWEAVDAARRSGATYVDHKACVLSAQLDPDQGRAATYLRTALLALARERDRALFGRRPALAAWLKERADGLRIPAEDRLAVMELLSVPARAEQNAGHAAGLQVSLLGPLDVRIGAQRIGDRAWRTSKAKELFSLLLMHRERALSRDEIIERLWPEAEPGSGISNFHFTLHALRKALASTKAPSAPTVRTEGGYQLLTADKAPVDIDVFQLLLHEAHRFRRAGRPDDAVRLFRATTALYRGDLLTDLDAEWVAERREDLVRQFLSGLRQLAELELERGEGPAAASACRRYLEREPYDEHVHRLLMRAYHAGGDSALVERHYRSLRHLLRRELGSEPERETAQLYERLRGKAGVGVAGTVLPIRIPSRGH